jgi:hypothetical protein
MADPSPTGGGTELGRFLRARRAQISPADVGLPVYQASGAPLDCAVRS